MQKRKRKRNRNWGEEKEKKRKMGYTRLNEILWKNKVLHNNVNPPEKWVRIFLLKVLTIILDVPIGTGKHRMVTAKYPDDDTILIRPGVVSAIPAKSPQGGGRISFTAKNDEKFELEIFEW